MNRPDGAQMAAGRMLGVLILAIDRRLCAMRQELAAQHVDKRPEAVKGVGGGMHADEGLAGLDPIDEGLAAWQGQIAGGVGEHHGIKAPERFG